MVEVAVFDEHRPDEDGADGWKLRDPRELFERKIHVLQGHYRGGDQPLWRCLADLRESRTVVCPAKAGMFSRGQTCRGRSQSPVVWIAEEMETEPSKPIDKTSRGGVTSHRAVE